MKQKFSDADIDRLLKNHAKKTGNPTLSNEQRATMIMSLLTGDKQESITAGKEPSEVKPRRSRLIPRPTASHRSMAIGITSVLALSLLVIVCVIKLDLFQQEPVLSESSQPAIQNPVEMQTRNPTTPPGKLRRILTIGAIQTVFQMRGEGVSRSSDSSSCAIVFSVIRSELSPLGISCTMKRDLMTTSLEVQSSDSTLKKQEAQRLCFRFNSKSGEVISRPVSFRIITASVGDDALINALTHAAEKSYHVLRGQQSTDK